VTSPKNWTDSRLGELCTLHGGSAFSRSLQGRVTGDIPFIKQSDMSLAANSLYIFESNNWVSESDLLELRAHPLPPMSVVFGKIGEGLKRNRYRVLTRPTLIDNNMMGAVPNSLVDQRFFAIVMSQIDMGSLSEGSALPYLRAEDVGNVRVLLPPLAEQRAIAGVLGALDDKIESNRRLQEICMSLAIVEHVWWRETVHSFVETTFGDFCDVFGGATPSTEEPSYWGGEFAWLTPTDVTALDAPYLFKTSRTLTDEGLKAASTRMHPVGTVFMTSRATIGAFAVAQIPCSTNQGFIAVHPRQDYHRWFIYHEMKSRVELMYDMSSGSTFRELSRGTFKNMEVSVPNSAADFERLAQVLEPLHSKAVNASRENFKLRALRDTLLPELLSGRLRVEDADLMMENV
jgi:type I restriction enzyme S subunit